MQLKVLKERYFSVTSRGLPIQHSYYLTADLETCRAVRRIRKQRKFCRKLLEHRQTRLIAYVLWLLGKADCRSPPSSVAALSKASEVPLIVCVLNAETLEYIHF